MRPHQLETLFNPTAIAVVGASENLDSVGGRLFHNLTSDGFKGTVVPVNPKYDTVSGHACVPSVADIAQPIDLAVIATPARTVVDIVRQCGEKNIASAIIASAGFGEAGADGERMERDLADTARRGGVRFVGPNCLGIQRPAKAMNATFLETSAPPGRLALVSQSGALCAAIVDYARPHHLGFSTIVSLGNAVDVDFGDVLDYLAIDPKSDAILLYVEGIKDARAFMSGLKLASRVKPVIVLKAGRGKGGSTAAATHTGALIGSDDVFDAALARAGVVRAMSFGQLFAAAEMLATHNRVGGDRLVIVTNGGGAGVLATDRAEELGVSVPTLGETTLAALDAALPPAWSHGNPVDVLGDAGPDLYGAAVRACLADRGVDGVLTLLTPQAMTDPDAVAEALVEVVDEGNGRKPLIACFMGETKVAAARKTLSAHGIPDFNTPESAVEAFSYLAKFRQNQELLLQMPGPFSDDRQPPDVEGARLIVESALSEGRRILSLLESKAVLSAFRIPCLPAIEASTATEALVAAESLGFPVVMKISSPQVSHKSDVGGVRMGLATAQEVRAAFQQMVASVAAAEPDIEIRGVTIEPMVSGRGNRELIVGIKRDIVFGPVVSFGAGGTMAEILRDNAVSLPPLNEVLAERLVGQTGISRLLGPFRDLPAVDRDAVEDVLLRLSDLACELPHVDELDINPLFANADRVVAADARIAIRRPDATPQRYGHMAIHPYPTQLVNRSYLPDGTELTIRPIRPEDADNEQAFVRGLSAEAKHYRFMLELKELTPQMLARFTQIDYSREMALIAVVREEGAPRQVGVARYVINPDGASGEFAIVIADEWQRRGLASMLMQALMEAARDHRLRSIEGEVLADNTAMLKLMASLGFSIRPHPDDVAMKRVERWI